MSETRWRVGRFLASSRLAAWLIGTQLAFLLVSYTVPQRGIFPDEQVDSFLTDIPGALRWVVETLDLDRVFTSAVFYAAAGLLAVNLVFCTWRRVARRLRVGQPAAAVRFPDSAVTVRLADAGAAGSALDTLRARELSGSEPDRAYYVRRGDVGFAGSVVMHGALVLVLLAGVLTGLTTFRGEMLLTEGQTLRDVPEDYLVVSQVPAIGTAFDDFSVTLERMAFTYDRGAVVDAVADLTVADEAGSRTGRARVNYPLKTHGKSFLLQDAGHSVWLTVADESNVVVFDSFVTLAGYTQLGYADSVALPDGNLSLVSRPDAARPTSEAVADGLDLTSPIVGLAFAEARGAEDFTWVEPGAPPARLGGYTISVREVRIWNRFMVRADGGRGLMYVAFGLIIAGSLARFLDPDRWLRCVVTADPAGSNVRLWGSDRYRPGALPREGRRLLRVLHESGAVEQDTMVGSNGEHPAEEER